MRPSTRTTSWGKSRPISAPRSPSANHRCRSGYVLQRKRSSTPSTKRSKTPSTPTPTPHSAERPRYSPATIRLHGRKDSPKTSQTTPSTLHGQSFARLSNTRGPRRSQPKRRCPSTRGSPKPCGSLSSNAHRPGPPRTRTLRHSFTRTSVHRPGGTKYSGSKPDWQKASRQWTQDKNGMDQAYPL